MTDFASLDLIDLIPALSPEHASPYHLEDWIALIRQAATVGVRALCALPIRHYKTETTLHGIVWLLLKDPSRRIIFLTYSDTTAQKRGKRIRDLATAAGVGPMRGKDTIADWENDKGGGVVVMSAKQSRLGLDCHVLIFDDPLDELDADDPHVREAVDATITHYTARCMRRGQPGPVLGVMSRWHPDDPIGRRLQRRTVTWIYVHRPAIIDEGEETERAFAPNVWDLPELRAMRAELAEKDPTERLWWAQLMGNPKPIGADLFGPATYYTQLPTFGFRRGFGVDMAFTVGDGADWFARCVGRLYGSKLYLLDVKRHKIEPHLIESTCKQDMKEWGRSSFFSYMSGPEVGMAKVLIERGVPIAKMHARYSKLVRAQRTIKRWNDGNILVPDAEAMATMKDAPTLAHWVGPFLHRLGCFRGREKDTDDDEADALVSMADGVMGGVVAGGVVRTMGKAYGGFNAPGT